MNREDAYEDARFRWENGLPARFIAVDPIRPPETDEEPWTPTDPPGFSMTGGDVFVLASVVAVSWAAVIIGVLLVRRIWRDGGAA